MSSKLQARAHSPQRSPRSEWIVPAEPAAPPGLVSRLGSGAVAAAAADGDGDVRVSVLDAGQATPSKGEPSAFSIGGGGGAPAAAARFESVMALTSMVLLVVQGTATSILLQFSRAAQHAGGTPYKVSVLVALTEALKLGVCAAVVGWQARGAAAAASPPVPWAAEARRQFRAIAATSAPMALPAAMFVMQQVLLIVAAGHLDAVAFQIFSQSFKLVPTALFAYWMLGQSLEPVQWASIPVLALGVCVVTLNKGPPAGGAGAGAGAPPPPVAAGAAGAPAVPLGWVMGMVACSVSGLSSAYAGVYFERYVKGKLAASLWVRNIQLGLYGAPFSLAYAAVKDGRGAAAAGGWLAGFDRWTWAVLATQVGGGLVVGLVVKYASNVLKNFALAVSVILTVAASVPLFGLWPSPWFVAGVALVVASVLMYARALPRGWAAAARGALGGARGLLPVALACAVTLMLLAGAQGAARALHGAAAAGGGAGAAGAAALGARRVGELLVEGAGAAELVGEHAGR